MTKQRISFLHIAPEVAQVKRNRRLVESALKVAAGEGADWVLTPELCIPGYLFAEMIGCDWILPQPDDWMQEFCGQVRDLGMTVFLSHPERDTETGKLHNTVFVIDPQGEIIGKHRKIRTLRGAEGWSSPGMEIKPVDCGSAKAGILICSDAYKNEVAQKHKDQGAQLLVSLVSWGPGLCGPDGEWEQRSADTGLPIMVCNRSGAEERELDYRTAESVVAQDGRRLLTAISDRSVVLSFDWDMDSMTLLSEDFDRAYV